MTEVIPEEPEDALDRGFFGECLKAGTASPYVLEHKSLCPEAQVPCLLKQKPLVLAKATRPNKGHPLTAGLFDEVDSMMGRHRHAGRPSRPLTMDQRRSGSIRSR